MDYLLNVDFETFHTFIYYWGALGILSSLALYFSKQLPISSRLDNQALGFLGSVDKKLGWIIMETPILIAVIYFYLVGKNPLNVSVVIVGVFVFH